MVSMTRKSALLCGVTAACGQQAGLAQDFIEYGFGTGKIGTVGTYTLHSITFSGIVGTALVDVYDQAQGSGAVQAFGVPTSRRLVYRGNFGWSGDGWSVTAFMNYRSHYFHSQNAPPAGFLTAFPNYSNLAPSLYTFDLSVGYNTGNEPSKDHIKNDARPFNTISAQAGKIRRPSIPRSAMWDTSLS
jgi:hypothetical protein